VNTQITTKGRKFDATSRDPLPLSELANAELVDAFNQMVAVAGTLGLEGPTPVKKFSDKTAGGKRVAALHSSIVAFAQGQADEKARVQKAVKKSAPVEAVQDTPVVPTVTQKENPLVEEVDIKKLPANPEVTEETKVYNALIKQAHANGFFKAWTPRVRGFEKNPELAAERIEKLKKKLEKAA